MPDKNRLFRRFLLIGAPTLRLRLLLRRLTISAPQMAVRNALSWPLRWLAAALLLGLCAAAALWVFEFGKSIAGIDRDAHAELIALRTELAQLREQREATQSVVNTAQSRLTTEHAAQQRLAEQVRQLETDNRNLREDLGFFEKLIPSSGNESLAIRNLQAQLQDAQQLKWQLLVIQNGKGATEFNGRLEITLSGLQQGKPWSHTPAGAPQALQLRQYRRFAGVLPVPPQTVVKTVTARVLEGGVVRATQTLKL